MSSLFRCSKHDRRVHVLMCFPYGINPNPLQKIARPRPPFLSQTGSTLFLPSSLFPFSFVFPLASHLQVFPLSFASVWCVYLLSNPFSIFIYSFFPFVLRAFSRYEETVSLASQIIPNFSPLYLPQWEPRFIEDTETNETIHIQGKFPYCLDVFLP